MYWNVNSFYEWAISKKLPVRGLRSIKSTSQFNKGDFIKITIKELLKSTKLWISIAKSAQNH